MKRFIGMEDLVANALIEVYENSNGDLNKVSFKQLNDYGAKIIRFFYEKDREAIILVSKYHTNELIRNYSDYFEIVDNLEDSYIKIKSGKTVEELRRAFRAYISIDMLLAFTNEECVEALVA